MASPRLAKFALIAAVAASMLMYEILLTRICALRLFFHFAFLVISNCLLGIAASGALITLYQDSWRQREPELLLRFSLLYMASLVVVYAVLLVYALPLALTLSNPSHFVQFSLFNLIGAIPFFCGGLVVGMVLSFNADIVNRLYGADLIGAALGCFSLPFLLAWGGAGGTMVAIVLLALVGVVAAVPVERRRPALVVGALLAAGGLAIFPTIDARFPVPVKSFVELSRNVDANTAAPPLWSAWSTNSRIDVLRARPASSRFIFGRGSKLGGMPPIPEQHVIMQDGSAGTFIVNFGEHPEALEIIERSLYSAAVHLRPGSDVFIIGAGGGNDLWAAKAAGAKRIKAVELNEPILRVHREVFPHYTRPLLEDPNVEIVIDEGRSALMQDEHRYGVLQMTGIDT